MKTARDKLGEVITFHLRQTGKSDHSIADRCGVSIQVLYTWRSGRVVPNGGEWKRLCQMVSRGLFGSSGLYKDALAEQDKEREMAVRALQRNGHTTTINGAAVTNFGDKLVESRVMATASQDQSAETTASVNGQSASKLRRDPGWRSVAAVQERREFAAQILRERPAAPYMGPDGVHEMMLRKFGAGISSNDFTRIRDAIQREVIEREVCAKLGVAPVKAAPQQLTPDPSARALPAQPVDAAASIAAESTRRVNDADVSAGVELIIGAIPGLTEMVITVDEAGVASVRYDVRKVEVTTVSSSLTVRR